MHNDQKIKVKSINDLRQIRKAAMDFAAFACAFGFVGCLAGIVGDHIQAASWLHPFSVSFAWLSLLCIAAVFAAMILVWIPVHDKIIASLRLSLHARWLPRVIAPDSFISASLRHSTPPPRHHIR